MLTAWLPRGVMFDGGGFVSGILDNWLSSNPVVLLSPDQKHQLEAALPWLQDALEQLRTLRLITKEVKLDCLCLYYNGATRP